MEAETIALWVGLISGIVSIVLSIVAIVFSILVNNRSASITDKTIQSLQKIESEVDRSSSDTRDLIKAAWDKMIGNMNGPTEISNQNFAYKEIVSGLAAELKAELNNNQDGKPEAQTTPQEQIDKLNGLLVSLEQSLESQLEAQSSLSSKGTSTDKVLNNLSSLSPHAQALARAILPRHLSLNEYRKLVRSPKLSEVITELRTHGLIVPLKGVGDDGKKEPVYYYPPSLAKPVRTAFLLVPKQDAEIQELITDELKRIGYFE
jgi:hypothetical protein